MNAPAATLDLDTIRKIETQIDELTNYDDNRAADLVEQLDAHDSDNALRCGASDRTAYVDQATMSPDCHVCAGSAVVAGSVRTPLGRVHTRRYCDAESASTYC